MEIWIFFENIYLVLVFQTFWYFFYFIQFACGEMLASRLWKNLLFLTHWLPSYEYHFNSLLLVFLLEFVLGFLALLPQVLRKQIIWIFSQSNWLVATWCRIFVWEISEQITKSFISFLFRLLVLYFHISPSRVFFQYVSCKLFRYLLILIGNLLI